ncbi:MAG: hypothetical protein NC548_64270 [Lachnospiraceae bacterium]|nr:hypothetical protein [Lachnospiraceae bacterium]
MQDYLIFRWGDFIRRGISGLVAAGRQAQGGGRKCEMSEFHWSLCYLVFELMSMFTYRGRIPAALLVLSLTSYNNPVAEIVRDGMANLRFSSSFCIINFLYLAFVRQLSPQFQCL